MNSPNVCAQKSLWPAVVISLLLHAAILSMGSASPGQPSEPAENSDESTNTHRSSLHATLARPSRPLAATSSAAHPAVAMRSSRKKPGASAPEEQQKLSAPTGIWANRSWTRAERADMDKFLDELAVQSAVQAKIPGGREMEQSALAMARQLGRSAQGDDPAERSEQGTKGKNVEPFSLEMYFDAFVRKLNRSAAFVKNDRRAHGSRKALVEISLNSDGSLKNYRVLRSADQETEIAYIKQVIDRAAPFSAFPPDLRKAGAALSIRMCIFPGQAGGGGFSRSFGDRDCKD